MSDETTRRWILQIQGAQSDAAVVLLVREYLATWTPSEIEKTPAGIWPGQLEGQEEICAAAVDVIRAELMVDCDPAVRQSLRELGTVLTAAANRFGQLDSPFSGASA